MCLVFVTWFFIVFFFFFKQKTAYEMRISDWSSDVCSSDLLTLDFNGSSNAYQRWRGGMGARTGLDEKVSKARIAASPSNVYYRSLKDDILSGRLRQGLKLTNAFLHERYKGGNGTMREAQTALKTDRKSQRLNSSH